MMPAPSIPVATSSSASFNTGSAPAYFGEERPGDYWLDVTAYDVDLRTQHTADALPTRYDKLAANFLSNISSLPLSYGS